MALYLAISSLALLTVVHAFAEATVKVGEEGKEVSFVVGVIDPNEGLMRIVRELPKQSRSTPYWVYGMRISYTAPARRQDWEQDLAAFMAENLPKVEAPVLAAEGVEVAFTPGTAPAGNPICRETN